MSEKDDFKNTINLPQTDFPMRGNMAQREPELLKQWNSGQLYQQILEQTKDRPLYVLHDGPPYANGRIHYGHILNKVLKDIVVKSRTMSGFRAVYKPGWDCHGLPIEIQVDRDLGSKKAQLSPVELRRHCHEYALKHVKIQREEFERLGVFGLWDDPYLTIHKSYEATIVRALAEFARQGYLYKGKKPVHWCASCRTALAEAEVEYQDHDSPSIYVKFPYLGEAAKLNAALAGKKVNFVIWTTTPWTLPANLAIALHPKYTYVAVEHQGQALIMAKELVAKVAADCGLGDSPRILGEIDTAAAEKTFCQHPFIDRQSLLVFADYVTLEAGTGCVHTAPGHGEDDYHTGLAHGLDIFAPVDNGGLFTDEVPDYQGRFVFETNKDIVTRLHEIGALLNTPGQKISHSYPHCWRCKKAVIFRATPQWFARMEHQDMRAVALREVDKTQWVPAWGHDRIYGMIANRPDWCLSRQRTWGVPIPVLYCQKCGEALATYEFMMHIAELFGAQGSDAWFIKQSSELVPAGTKCAKCGATEFEKEKDIVDVWFESGVSWAAVCESEKDLWPIDLYLEGSDQHRGWFHSALLTSVATRGKAPYKTVLTHGFVVDENGKPYSKSLKNFIPPENVIKNKGAELFRLWASYVDYRYDMPFSESILEQLGDSYRKVRNTARFLLGNLSDYDPTQKIDEKAFSTLDKWALSRLSQFVSRCRASYDNFEFHVVFRAMTEFCTVDLSAFYLDVAKDILYCEAASSPSRRAVQHVLYQIARALATLMAPIFSFTAEDIWSYLPKLPSDPATVHLARFPEAGAFDDALIGRVEKLMHLRELVLKQLEPFRAQKHHSLDAHAVLTLNAEDFAAATAYGQVNLADLCIVSSVEIISGASESSVKIVESQGKKCPRCWKRTAGSGDERHADLCPRCAAALKSQAEKA